MKYTKAKLNLEYGLKREWLITNGIGGYASSTILGINTRRYHGLLIAPLKPPADRQLILSKLDEAVEIEGKNYPLYTNICHEYIGEGYKNQEMFEKEFVPIFTYKVGKLEIKKVICMQHGRNTVTILYKIINKGNQAKLTLAPIVNMRNSHDMSTNREFRIEQNIYRNKVRIIIDENWQNSIYVYASEGNYIEHDNDIFRNMYYVEEEKRGFYPEENHCVTGRYEINIEQNEEKDVTFVCSLEENIEGINARDVIEKEIKRLNEKIYDSKLIHNAKKEIKDKRYRELINQYMTSIDNFIIYRPSFRLHSIIAGYPWFLDWGRDSLISFEGLLLKTRQFEIAKELLRLSIRDVKYGLVPNGYSDENNTPLYNSVDSSLLLFEQINKYIRYTKDKDFIKEKIYPTLLKIIEAYIEGIDVYNNNIYLKEDGLLSSGTENTQNTWMDVKYEDFAVTPRNGKAVEINSLWYNALKTIEKLSLEFDEKEKSLKYKKIADKCKKSFNNKFYNAKKKCLYDVVDRDDDKIRPNQIFAIALSYPVMNPSSDESKQMFKTVTDKLLNNYGLKTLAKKEKNYIEIYEGNSFKRDMSYHQGITWPWLLGIYFDGLKNIIKYEKDKEIKSEYGAQLNNFVEELSKTYYKEIEEGMSVGTISELYDSVKPYSSKGTIAQAWSVAEVFRIIIDYEKKKAITKE